MMCGNHMVNIIPSNNIIIGWIFSTTLTNGTTASVTANASAMFAPKNQVLYQFQ